MKATGEVVPGRHEHAAGPKQIVPFSLETTIAVKNLDPMVLAIRNEALQRSASQVMLCTMLNSPGAVPDPPDDFSNRPSGEKRWTRALPYPSAIDVAIRRQRSVAAAAERIAAQKGLWLSGRAKRQKQLAIQ